MKQNNGNEIRNTHEKKETKARRSERKLNNGT